VYRFFRLQPFTKRTIKVLMVTALIFALELFLPHFTDKAIDIAVRTILVSGAFLFVVYRLKIVEEFHQYLPWERK
jgi:hypothetical protein